MYNLLFLLLAILSFHSIGLSQCDSTYYTFYTQKDVDSFQSTYGPCDQLKFISILDTGNSDIKNLVGLKDIKSIEGLHFENGSLMTFQDLSELRYIGEVNFRGPNHVTIGFPQLDTIGEIDHYFPNNSDLTLYENVQYIGNLQTRYDGSLSGLKTFIPSENFSLTVLENSSFTDIDHVIKGASVILKRFELTRSSNINLSGIESIPAIRVLQLSRTSETDLSPLLEVDSIESFIYLQGGSPLNFKSGFTNITNLDYLQVSQTTNLKLLDELFPNLRKINHRIVIKENTSLESLDFLSDFPSLQRTKLNLGEKYISISRNTQLETCNNQFICNAIKQFSYPDSILIFNNGRYCNYDSLSSRDCLSLSSKDLAINQLTLYPVPANDNLMIGQNLEGNYSIYCSNGLLVDKSYVNDRSIPIGDLPKDQYILKLTTSDSVYIGRFIKS